MLLESKLSLLKYVDYLREQPLDSYVWTEHDNKIKKEMMMFSNFI